MITADQITLSPDIQTTKLVSFLNNYITPSFGSMSKRDCDVALFSMMQDLGIIKMNPQIYEVVSLLHVTSSKARNLIYESSLRRKDKGKLDEELTQMLQKPVFLLSSDKMLALEIDDPLLIDHLKFKLRNLGHLTDGSFNLGLVKMSYDAYYSLVIDTLSPELVSHLSEQLDDAELRAKFGIVDGDGQQSKIRKCFSYIFGNLASVAVKKESEHIMVNVHGAVQNFLGNVDVHAILTWIQENGNEIIQHVVNQGV